MYYVAVKKGGLTPAAHCRSGTKSTVDGVHRPGNKGGFRPGEPGDHTRYLFRATVTFNRHKAVHHLLQRPVLRVGIGINGAGLDDVDGDP